MLTIMKRLSFVKENVHLKEVRKFKSVNNLFYFCFVLFLQSVTYTCIIINLTIFLELDTCKLPALVGECRNYVNRWYFNSLEGRCRQFYYGGCGGNDNNFATEYECEGRCIDSGRLTTIAPPQFTRGKLFKFSNACRFSICY